MLAVFGSGTPEKGMSRNRSMNERRHKQQYHRGSMTTASARGLKSGQVSGVVGAKSMDERPIFT
jgi:hypothetical protein